MQWAELQPLLRHFSLSEQRKIERAFRLAADLHAGQLRQSGDPYFSHPAAVAAMLAAMGADRDTLIAALLHDAVEDTPITLQEIDERFDGAVASLIEGVTKLCATDVGERPQLNEQIETLRKMFTLMERDVRVMVIKLVDRLHNMRTAEYLSPERRRALAQEDRQAGRRSDRRAEVWGRHDRDIVAAVTTEALFWTTAALLAEAGFP